MDGSKKKDGLLLRSDVGQKFTEVHIQCDTNQEQRKPTLPNTTRCIFVDLKAADVTYPDGYLHPSAIAILGTY